jgi:cell division protein FtsI/penicillin-binding protein 2
MKPTLSGCNLLKSKHGSRATIAVALAITITALVLLPAACRPTPPPSPTMGPLTPGVTPTAEALVTATAPPEPTVTEVVEPAHRTAAAFLEAWAEGDTETMYALCASEARAAVPYGEFTRIYDAVADESTAIAYRPTLRAVLEREQEAVAAFDLEVETSFVGTFQVDNELPLVREGGRWAVAWSKRCIYRELQEDYLVHMAARDTARANIYDVNGKGLASEGSSVIVGVVPGEIEDEPALLARLSLVLDIPQSEIKAMYEGQPATWFIPLGDISIEQSRVHYELLSTEPGISLRERAVRVYRDPPAAPHIVGYLGHIPSEELASWQALGYTGDELVGRTGIEAWAEPFLAGQRGGELTIITPGGQVVAALARREAIPPRSVYLTLDYEFQRAVEGLLGERKGSVVVMDVRDGRILALATWPRYDPNLFAEGIAPQDWSALVNDPDRPLLNRAIQGQYPPGSAFKIVSMGTVMERAGAAPTTTYQCPGVWDKLGWVQTCWLKAGHGTIDLISALTASCDVTFYQVGYDLSFVDRDALPSYARSFGFGAPAGIGKRLPAEGQGRLVDAGELLEGWDPLGEAPGLVPDDAWKRQTFDEGWATGDNVNLAIGQGFLLVTPLQMARMVAAVANGGVLYRPQIVGRVAANDREQEVAFKAERVGRLPVTEGTLQAIRQGMLGATTSPRGTATHRFVDFAIAVAGKTGTAQNEGELPHAWFVGYLPAEDPEIAIVAMVENSGEGSQFAAPLFRHVAALYYGLEDEAPTAEGQGD